MRFSSKFLTVAFALGLCGGSAAENAVTSPTSNLPLTASNADTTWSSNFTSQQIIETWGWIIAHEKAVAGIEISETERSAFLKGFAINVKGRPAPYDLQKIYPDVERLSKARREKVVRALIQKNEAEAEKFFTKLKENTNVIELPSRVCYEIIKPGNGSYPKPQQTVNVHYTGRLIDGTEFLQFESIDLVLVTNRSVCRGWFEALQKIDKGGAMKFYVPPPLSEEDAFKFGIQPGSAMVFEVELLDIKDTSAEDLANSVLPPAPEPPPPPRSGYTERQVLEMWGWDIAQQTPAAKFRLSETELSWLTKGLTAGIKGEPSPFDLRKIYPAVEKFVADHRDKVRLETKRKRLAEMGELFARLKKNKKVIELPDGLYYEILKPGSGPYPKPGQIVIVDYTGHLIDGKVFDRTDNEPLHIEIGSVMPGLNEGMQKINKGGKIKLYIPPTLGYGDEDASSVISSVPANSVLIYEIELLEIQDAPKDDTAPASEKK